MLNLFYFQAHAALDSIYYINVQDISVEKLAQVKTMRMIIDNLQ